MKNILIVTKYFTLKKNLQNKGSNRNYLLLNFKWGGKTDFKNTKSDETTKFAIIMIIVSIVILVIVGVIISLCCCWIRKKKIQVINNQPYHGNPQVYPQQCNLPLVYGG